MHGYFLGPDYGPESKFRTHKSLTVLNVLKYKYCVNTVNIVLILHETILLKISNNFQIDDGFKKRNLAINFLSFILSIFNTSRLE